VEIDMIHEVTKCVESSSQTYTYFKSINLLCLVKDEYNRETTITLN